MNRAVASLLVAILAGGCADAPPPEPEPPDPEPALTQITLGGTGEDKDPEVLPDGKTLIYASSAFSRGLDLFAKEIGSNVARRLTSRPGHERFPRANPVDPDTIAFCSNDRGEWDIYLLNLKDPEKWQLVSESGMDDLHPSWSPDGLSLVYSSLDDAEHSRGVLRILDLRTKSVHSLESVQGLLPEWSPDGKRIVFQKMRERGRWLSSLWTVEIEGGSARNLTAVLAGDEWAAIHPSWSPDGRRLVFATVGRSRSRADIHDQPDDIWMVNADGTFPTRLTTSPAGDGMPTWSRDGKIYFVSDRSGTNRIWRLEARLPGGEN